MNDTELAYIAGFFDGEGSAYLSNVKASNGIRYPRLSAKIYQNDTKPLVWIQELYGFGKIYAKPQVADHGINHYLVFAYRQARFFLSSVEDLLIVKKENVSNLLNISGRLYLPL
jgi:hypothetical protein